VTTEATREARPAARGGRLEIAAAAMLSVAAVGSSWCGYQATRWGGTQMKAFGRANALHIDAVRESMRQQVLAAIDVSAFVSWVEARMRADAATADFLQHRFRPGFVPAFSAWMGERPFERDDATPTPFARPEYHLESQVGAELDAESRRQADISLDANGRVEDFVRNTVLFAVAMLFGGLAPRFHAASVRTCFIVVGASMLVFALVSLVLILSR
jgi:hypothetical protein